MKARCERRELEGVMYAFLTWKSWYENDMTGQQLEIIVAENDYLQTAIMPLLICQNK